MSKPDQTSTTESWIEIAIAIELKILCNWLRWWHGDKGPAQFITMRNESISEEIDEHRRIVIDGDDC